MANIQEQFKTFNRMIRLDFENHRILQEKRDIIRDRLEERLPTVFAKHGEECPKFWFRDQGSYEMKTGINPLDCDFDIDQGIYFAVSTVGTYEDPVKLKERVYEALEGHTQDVRVRRSCVTAFYHEDGEVIFHVDIAVYSDGSCDTDGKTRLAKGKQYSTEANRIWEIADPQGLSATFLNKYTDRANLNQFRRIVRYLKRWKLESFSQEGNEAPLGIGLTVAVYDYLPSFYNAGTGSSDDLGALRTVVRGMLNGFTRIWDEETQQFVRRLRVTLPVEPCSDLFGKMPDTAMASFERKLEALLEALDYAAITADPVDACEELNKELSVDFPVPDKAETAKRHAPAISYSGNSA